MKIKKIVVLTHNSVRDPITDDCLAVELKKKGHFIWRRNFLDNDRLMITMIKPDIVVLPELRCEYSLDYARQCRQWGIQVVIRPCEVGISEESLPAITDDYRRAIFGENWPCNDALDLFLAWGPKMADLFHRHGGLDADKMAEVGGIAFDQFFLPPPPMEIKPSDKKRIMFATGFAYADRNPQYSVPEAKADDPLHQDMVKCDLHARSAWFDLIKKFAAQHSDQWDIIIKLHPGERQEVYTAVLAGEPVSYCPHLPPVMALQYADLIVHAGSTMAYEAHLLKKPAINLRNICQDKVVAKVSPNAETYEELDALIHQTPLGQSNADPAIVEILERDYYGKTDGMASYRAAEAICGLPDNAPQVPAVWPKSKDCMKYATRCILKDVEQWHCAGCQTTYYVQGPREMVKCPSCGIANVKTLAS